MAWFEELLRGVHIIFGFAGLAAFWVPVIAPKGGVSHRRFGRIFVRCAWVVLGSAGVAVAYHLASLHASGLGPSDRPNQYAFLVFLGYLSLVTWINVRHAVAVLVHKRDPAALATPLNVALGWTCVAASVVLIVFALWLRPPSMVVLLALSPIGFGIGGAILRYLRRPPELVRAWMFEHLGAMIGAGIAFHTAFAVFGVTRLFDYQPTGITGVLPWILPAAIGIPATVILTRHYRRRYEPAAR